MKLKKAEIQIETSIGNLKQSLDLEGLSQDRDIKTIERWFESILLKLNDKKTS